MVLKEIAQVIGTYLDGSHGATGRAQGAAMALAVGIGCFNLLRVGCAVDQFLWRQFLRPAKNLKKYGSWAAVTGATDGIGRAYCDELAKQGLHLLLISRTESKLKAAAEEIASAYGVKTKILVVDLVAAGNTSCEGPEWAALKAMASELDIGVLINNAGQGSSPSLLHEMTTTEVDSIVAINCAALVKATHAVLPSMVARGTGAIVNLSSAAGSTSALPCMAVYAASKAFVQHLSRSLAEEYGSCGIDIQAVSPAMVSTKMCPVPPSWKAPTADRYAAAAVRHIGYEDQAVPYWGHAMQRPKWQLPQPFMMFLMRAPIYAARRQTIARRDAERAEKFFERLAEPQKESS